VVFWLKKAGKTSFSRLESWEKWFFGLKSWKNQLFSAGKLRKVVFWLKKAGKTSFSRLES